MQAINKKKVSWYFFDYLFVKEKNVFWLAAMAHHTDHKSETI